MSMSLPPSDCMIPGEVYVTKFAGDKKPSFVRKRRQRSSFCDTLSSAFAFSGRLPRSNKMMSWSLRNWSHPEDDYECYAPARRRRRRFYMETPGLVPAGISQGRLATSISQVCAACGKHRSPAWSSRHPLLPGEMPKPTLCKHCRSKSTSSEDSSYGKHCHKKKHKHHRHCDHSSEEEHYCSRGGHSHSYSHRHSCGPRRYERPYSRNSSRESVNIFVNNESHAVPIVSEPSTSTTEEEVHVVRRTLPRSRSRAVLVEEARDRPLRHRRSHSSVRIVRSRSPAPRRRDTVYGTRPRRHQRRSSSHVSFVDAVDEIPVARSRRPTFHRVFYDGADSGEVEAQRVQSSDEDESTPSVQTIKPSATNKDTLTGTERFANHLSFQSRVSQQRSALGSFLADSMGTDARLKVETRHQSSSPSKSTHDKEKGKSRDEGSSRSSRSKKTSASPFKKRREHTDLSTSGNYSDYYGKSPPFAQTRRPSCVPDSRSSSMISSELPSSKHKSPTSPRSPSIKDLSDLACHLAEIKLAPSSSSFSSSRSSSLEHSGTGIDIAIHLTPETTPTTSFDAPVARSLSPTPTEGTVEYEIPFRVPTPQRRRQEKFWEVKEFPAAEFDDYVDGSNDFSHLDMAAFGIENHCPVHQDVQPLNTEDHSAKKTRHAHDFDDEKPIEECTAEEMEYLRRKGEEVMRESRRRKRAKACH